jgi:predicted RNA polymerase sigma factor
MATLFVQKRQLHNKSLIKGGLCAKLLTRERGKLSTEGQVSLQSIVVSCVARPSKAAVHDRLSIIHH